MDVNLYKKILKEKGMTYEDLSQKTGLSLGCIKRVMAGIARYPRIDTIEAIESALGLSSEAITAEEYASGLRTTKKVSITPIEEDMLNVFRKIGEKDGEERQRLLISMAEGMLKG